MGIGVNYFLQKRKIKKTQLPAYDKLPDGNGVTDKWMKLCNSGFIVARGI